MIIEAVVNRVTLNTSRNCVPIIDKAIIDNYLLLVE
jgi:hypothetical protein